MGHRPVPKPDDRRQRRNKRPSFALATRSGLPQVPKGLLKITTDRWTVYWESDLARATRAPHLPVVERLFFRYDERERAYRTVRKQGRVTKGSMGQLVPHPLLKYIDSCDSEIRQLEDRLGLSPRGMAQLGSTFASAEKNLNDLNRSLEEDDDNVSDADPRVQIVK